MANVLDYLLPQSFMSDVQTVFKPKNSTGYGINKLQSSQFTPGFKDANNYSVYSNLLDQGYQPTQEMQDIIQNSNVGFVDRYGKFYKDNRDSRGRRISGLTPVISYNNKMYPADQFLKTFMDKDSDEFGFAKKDIPAPNLFSGESMAQGFERAGLSDYDPAMTKPLKLSSLRNLDAGSYTGELESKRATLAQGLQSNLRQASQIGSGFAGYGQRNIASNLAQNQYSQGIEGVYQGINQQRATALQGLYSSLDDMRGLISKNNG